MRGHRTELASFVPSKSSAFVSIQFKPTDFVRRIDRSIGPNAAVMKMRRLDVGAIPTVEAAGEALRNSQSKKEVPDFRNVILNLIFKVYQRIHRCYFGFTEIIFVDML